MFLPACCISSEVLLRRSLGSVEPHTGQLQPTIGTPVEVPLPRTIIFIEDGRIADAPPPGKTLFCLQPLGGKTIIPGMRAALISPFSSGPVRGNIITVQRIAQHLPATGCEVLTIGLDTAHDQLLDQQLDRFRPDLLHAFHAFHSGPKTRLLARQRTLPYLITMTGSDLHEAGLCDHPDTVLALRDTAAITCFDQPAAEQLITRYPQLAERVVIIPQGVEPLEVHHPVTRSPDLFVILLPAAIRPVKGILEAIQALTPLAAEFPQLRLWLAGGDLDPRYAAQVRHLASSLPWLMLLGEVAHGQMGDLFASADLIVNNSRFEGGMANSLLEAMAAARPVIARNVPGNRSLIKHGITGWLFDNQQELQELIRHTVTRKSLLHEVGAAARELVTRHYSARREAYALVKLYQQIIAAETSRQ